MKARLEEGISNWLFITIILACASPAITLNVWPRIEAILGNGITSNQIGIVLLVSLSALGMTIIPFAMKKAENLGFWSICLVFGIGLGILNYTMAVGAIGKSRDEEAGGKALVIQRAAALRSSIAEGEAAKAALPLFRWTSPAMVESAANAVNLADSARKDECQKVGDHCRARVAQLSNRQSELAITTADRASTEQREALDSRIQRLQSELSGLGAIPQSTDMQASRIAGLVGGIISLGPDASERVATGLIHFLALCAEAFALGMPRIIVTALSRKPNVEKPQEMELVPQAPKLPRTPPSPTHGQALKKLPTQRPSKKAEASITEWKQTFLIRSTGKLRDWEAFEHYKESAKQMGLSPSSFLVFNQELTRLGVTKETDPLAKRDFYLEVAIKQPLKVVS